VHEALLSRSEEEGRSVSNLCAFLLEDALREQQREGQPATTMLSPSHPRSFATKPFGLKPWLA